VQAYYREMYCPPDDPYWKQDPGYGVLQVIGSIVPHVFALAEYIPFDDVRHKRLADLLLGLKEQAVQEFNPDVSQPVHS
jgi:hypothetical protein